MPNCISANIMTGYLHVLSVFYSLDAWFASCWCLYRHILIVNHCHERITCRTKDDNYVLWICSCSQEYLHSKSVRFFHSWRWLEICPFLWISDFNICTRDESWHTKGPNFAICCEASCCLEPCSEMICLLGMGFWMISILILSPSLILLGLVGKLGGFGFFCKIAFTPIIWHFYLCLLTRFDYLMHQFLRIIIEEKFLLPSK